MSTNPSQNPSPASEPRIVKRYSNRKLYDTVESRYVTLPQIAELVRKGEDVRIIDNNSKEDLTSVTLAQILYEEERKQSSTLPLTALKDLINTSRERIMSTLSPVTRLINRESEKPAEKAAAEAPAEPAAPEPPAPETPEAAHDEASKEPGRMQQFFEESRVAIDQWQGEVDKRMRTFWEGINPTTQMLALQAEIRRLQQRVDALEARAEGREEPAKRSAAPQGEGDGE